MLEIKEKENLELVSVHLPRKYIELLNLLVRQGLYPSRSEAIRIAVRDLIHKEILILEKSRKVIA